MIVRFSYQPLTAGDYEVGIAGDFTKWKIYPLDDHDGLYIYDIDLNPGRYRYKFIIDGVWQADPSNPNLEPDPFGGVNSVISVTEKHKVSTIAEALSRYKEGGAKSHLYLTRPREDMVELRFLWYANLGDSISLCLGDQELPLYPVGQGREYYVWHRNLEISDSLSFCILISYQGEKYYLGTGSVSDTLPDQQRLQINPRDMPIFEIPDWLNNAIIYQIFMDRFCNGDKSNDQDFSEFYYEGSRTPPASGTLQSPHHEYYHFVDDWYDISSLKQNPYLPEGMPDWWSFYGGDIAGVRSKLDYLQDLGITLIYFNPLWEAKSNHKYDAADFMRVDPHFGSSEELKELVQDAHARGIRVILDVAYNHSGESFWAFRDTVVKGPNSPYWHWYDWYKWPLPDPLPDDFKPREYYQCWWGIKDMPDLNYDLARQHPLENSIRNIKHAEVNWDLVNHILEASSWWISEIGMDGFRLDVPDEVPWWFWQLFRERIKSIRPDAWLVGEIWHNAKDWIDPRYFDSVMNYAYFRNPVVEFFIQSLISKEQFCARIEEGLAEYPAHASKAMMNLLGSHDTQRIRQIAKEEILNVMQAVFFQMTFVGVPHIYYGDEIGMMGGKDPDNRRPFNWRWEEDPISVKLRMHYKELIALRKKEKLFREGEFLFEDTDDDLLIYRRYQDDASVFCIMNLSTQHRESKSYGDLIFTSYERIQVQGTRIILPPGAMCIQKS